MEQNIPLSETDTSREWKRLKVKVPFDKITLPEGWTEAMLCITSKESQMTDWYFICPVMFDNFNSYITRSVMDRELISMDYYAENRTLLLSCHQAHEVIWR